MVWKRHILVSKEGKHFWKCMDFWCLSIIWIRAQLANTWTDFRWLWDLDSLFWTAFLDMHWFWCLSAMRTKVYLKNGWADFEVLGCSRFVIRYSIFYFCVSLLIFCFVSELLPIRTKTRGFWCLSGMRTKHIPRTAIRILMFPGVPDS